LGHQFPIPGWHVVLYIALNGVKEQNENTGFGPKIA
jgi:hypothetical protein